MERQVTNPLTFQIFATGSSFEIGDVAIETFSVPHDAYDPVGFLLKTSGGNIGFLTDLGHATKLIVERVRQANVLVLEANYDRQLLNQDTKRPWSTKQRIMSRHGHLSNEGAAEVAEQIVTENLRHIYLGHLSQDCNDPEVAHRTVADRLQQVGASHVRIETTTQKAPSPTLTLNHQSVAAAAN